MESSVLHMHHVEKTFRQGKQLVSVLNGATAIFEQGKTYALMGISGTGKSTILQLLAGIDVPCAGMITYNNKNIADFTEREHQQFLQDVVGLVFQMPYLIDELSVCENVMIKGLMQGQSFAKNRHHAVTLLSQLGLEHKIEASPAALSGGEQQRVALARALFAKPQFLLADEPTAHLDVETKRMIMELLLAAQKDLGMGMIIATHDRDVAQLLDTRLQICNGIFCDEGHT